MFYRFRFRPKVKNILSVIHCAIPTTSDANKTGRIEQLGRRPLNTASGAKDADIPINGQGKTAVMRQKIGTLNFPPLNQENGAKGEQDGHAGLATTSDAKASRTTLDCVGLLCQRPHRQLIHQ